MNIIHSFRGKGSSKHWLILNAILYTLSCMLCKKWGYNVILYCDNIFYKYVKDIAPYDKINLDLIEQVETPPKHIYADTKFRVMDNQDLGDIHIDGDVFLFSNSILDVFDEDWDVLVQCRESEYNTKKDYWTESIESLKYCNFPSWARKKCTSMYNCGVICIRNESLKKKYFETYWDMYNQYKTKGIDMDCVPDIIIEQQFLEDLCISEKYKVKFLLGEKTVLQDAKKIRYSHLIGGSKYKHIINVLKVIYKNDKKIYFKLKEKYGRETIFGQKWPY